MGHVQVPFLGYMQGCLFLGYMQGCLFGIYGGVPFLGYMEVFLFCDIWRSAFFGIYGEVSFLGYMEGSRLQRCIATIASVDRLLTTIGNNRLIAIIDHLKKHRKLIGPDGLEK